MTGPRFSLTPRFSGVVVAGIEVQLFQQFSHPSKPLKRFGSFDAVRATLLKQGVNDKHGTVPQKLVRNPG
jgi:hypothetical protein